jgi:SpoVK/Ycf46/Vps4 family AAA+-type ATPase
MGTHPIPSTPASSSVTAALARWSGAAARLGLPGPATAAGALLLASELDGETYERIVDGGAGTIAPRRVDLLRVLGEMHGDVVAAAGLAALEERGVAAPLGNYAGPWLKAEMEFDHRVRAYCMGAVAEQPAPLDGAQAYPILRIELALAQAAMRCASEGGRLLVLLRGRPGSGRDLALRRFLAIVGAPMWRRSPHELRQAHDRFEPELSGAAAVWDARRTDPSPDDYEIARRFLARSPTAAVAMLDRHQDAPDVQGCVQLVIDVDAADAAERREGWEAALHDARAPRHAIEAVVSALPNRSRAGAGLALRAARTFADQPARDGQALLELAERALAALVCPSTTRGIVIERPAIPLERIVARPDIIEALRHIVLLARLSCEIDTPGRVGVKALFAGPSGTGKTMAARAVATELRLPLYRIDLASVVSKWVGETEKNLREALSAAEAAGAVLLFDEGDALFGKRGEVTRGADRYANMEVSYLLQALEAYEGVAVVTTNVRGNVDTAFERRFDASIEFLPPTPPERERIWRQELANAARELPDVLLSDIAKRADLHGGSIAAAARFARVLARHAGRDAVGEQDLRASVRIEVLKSGSSVQAARWTKNDG